MTHPDHAAAGIPEITAAAERLTAALAISLSEWPGQLGAPTTDLLRSGDPVTLHVALEIARSRPQSHVLVFGTGAGAWELGEFAARSKGRAACTIVDHDPDSLLQALMPDASSRPLPLHRSRWCAISAAPLVLRHHAGIAVPGYRHAEIIRARQWPADVVVAYGPPPELGSRRGIILQALTFARPGSVIVLPGLTETEQARITKLQSRLPHLFDLVDCSDPADESAGKPGNRRLAAIALRALQPDELTVARIHPARP